MSKLWRSEGRRTARTSCERALPAWGETASLTSFIISITADHLIDQITAALTGANISTYGGPHPSLVLSPWTPSDQTSFAHYQDTYRPLLLHGI